MKILAVEDQPIAAMLIRSIITSLGYEVELASDCVSAMKLLSEGSFRIVVCDWRMEGMDGLDFCREVRKFSKDYIYFVLVSTTRITRESRAQAFEAGIDDFLAKPVDPDELNQRIRVAKRILDLDAQVKQLESFLPICGYCKKIRTDDKYWEQIETYFSRNRGERFTHGVCPECFDTKVGPQLRAMGIDPKTVNPFNGEQ